MEHERAQWTIDDVNTMWDNLLIKIEKTFENLMADLYARIEMSGVNIIRRHGGAKNLSSLKAEERGYINNIDITATEI